MKINIIRLIPFLFLFCCTSLSVFSQGSAEYDGGYKIKFNDDGSKYLRIISWGQFWAQGTAGSGNNKDINFSVRRARILALAQLNKKFLIITHFGLNSLNGDNLSTTGKGESAQLFLHAMWAEYRIVKNHNIGIGLHYWNGISRLNNQSTLNMLTLDNNRQSWSTLGLTDQFVRHIGVYLKGKFGKLQYRVAINEASTNNLQATVDPEVGGPAVYAGRRLLGAQNAGFVYSGYFDYNLLDQESNLLPYKVGTYLGSKKVLNIGAGFFIHPNGSVIRENPNLVVGDDVAIFSVDAFYDAPLGGKNDAITAYLAYQNSDYGRDYELGQTYATGGMLYSHVGYLIPGDKEKIRYQPYASFQFRDITAQSNTATRFAVGGNVYFTGHHSKVSLEYSNGKYANEDNVGVVTLQAMVYL